MNTDPHTETDQQVVPGLTPAPELRQLDRFVGTWKMVGKLIGAEEETIRGTATYRWLPGGFFMEQRVQLDFAGMAKIDSCEIIGYDAETGTFPSTVYSNMSPLPLPYTWRIDGDEVTITVQHGPLDATFRGSWKHGQFAGTWRPNPGADETVNVPYEIRVAS